MKTKTKALILALCAIMLVVASVFGTLAYLTDKTEVVENTFTVGKVHIYLDEEDTDDSETYNGLDESDILDEERDFANKYHLLPGQTYVKDPMVTVLEDSEESYVRMIVTVKNVDELKLALPQDSNPDYYADGKFLIQYLVTGWDDSVWQSTKTITETTEKDQSVTATYEFRYVGTANKGTKDGTVAKVTANTPLAPLFEEIVVPGNLDNDAIAHLANVVINVEAHAIQATGFEADSTRNMTAVDVAWEAFDNQMN